MLTLVTPTDGRPEAFALLEGWIAAQDWPEAFQWIVAGRNLDGYQFRCNQTIVVPGERKGVHPLNRNLLAALEHVEGDAVLIVEDDDWYAPSYLRTMAGLLDRADLVGITPARYYHARARRFRQHANTEHASLAQTGLRLAALPALAEACRGRSPFLDRVLWRDFAGSKRLEDRPGLHVSVKGLPGTAGIGTGHHADMGQPDPDGRTARLWGLPAAYDRFAAAHEYAPDPNPDAWVAPLRNPDGTPSRQAGKPWEGRSRVRPYQYRVTATVAHLDTPEPLEAVLETLRAQTERPYLLVVDTGSLADRLAVVERWEREHEDLELIRYRPKGFFAANWPCAVSLDFALAACQTEYLYLTHVDVFLKQPNYIEWLVSLCDAHTPIVGYQMSERPWWDGKPWAGFWRRCPSHTATLLHVPTCHRLGLAWNMAHSCRHWSRPLGQYDYFPDTEIAFGLSMQRAGVGVRWLGEPSRPEPTALFLGTEPNHPYEDAHLRHERSYTGNLIHARPELADRRRRMAEAIAESRARVASWSP